MANKLIDKLIKEIRKKTAVSPTVKVEVLDQRPPGVNPSAGGAYRQGQLYVDPNSDVVENVIAHELGHAQQQQVGQETPDGTPVGYYPQPDGTMGKHAVGSPLNPMSELMLNEKSSPEFQKQQYFQMATANLKAEQEAMGRKGESPGVDIDSLMNRLANQKREQDLKKKKKSAK